MIAHEGVLDLTSAEGLAEALGLNPGEVAAVHVSSISASERASVTFLEVQYANTVLTLPTRIVLKQKPPRPAGAEPALGTEADFYFRFVGRLPSPPVVCCLAARDFSDTSPGYILLEDVSASHSMRLRHDETDLGHAVDALAGLHAARWESDERRTWPRGGPTERLIRSHIQWVAARLPAFFDAAGDALGADGRRLYERVCSSGLAPWLRLLDGRALTLVHGDAHVRNFLVPRALHGAAYLIDWDRWRADIGPRDLAFMMLGWPPHWRRLLEKPLLKRYLARLEALGVRGYDWNACWTDYRICWVRNLTIPVTRFAQGRSDAWDALGAVRTAFLDLEGEELL